MILIGLILLLIGALVPMNSAQAKQACIIIGIILMAVGAFLWVSSGTLRYY